MSGFRVLQFNMQYGQGWDDADPDHAPVDLDATLEEIMRHGADIINLQEVEQVGSHGAQAPIRPNYTRLQAGLPAYESVFSYPRPDVRELPFGVGLATFAKGGLGAVYSRNLPSPPLPFEFEGEPTTPTDRLLTAVKVTLGQRELRVLNTHLLAFFMLKSSSALHPTQRRLVVEELLREGGPTILTGDFNVRDTMSLCAQFDAAGFRPVQTGRNTWRRQPHVLDHIFYNASFRCVRHEVVPTPTSDHHLLLADFEWVE